MSLRARRTGHRPRPRSERHTRRHSRQDLRSNPLLTSPWCRTSPPSPKPHRTPNRSPTPSPRSCGVSPTAAGSTSAMTRSSADGPKLHFGDAFDFHRPRFRRVVSRRRLRRHRDPRADRSYQRSHRLQIDGQPSRPARLPKADSARQCCAPPADSAERTVPPAHRIEKRI
jgi:hypothetical protein